MLNTALLMNSFYGKSAPMNSRTFFGQGWPRNVCLLAAVFTIATCEIAHGQDAPTIDETAHFLAGLPTPGALAPLTLTSGWREHAAALDKAWKTKDYFQLTPIASFMKSRASEHYRSSATMYCMFGGPDFLYASTFFPNANTYILAGLEPVGQVPDLSRMNPDTLRNNLVALLYFAEHAVDHSLLRH